MRTTVSQLILREEETSRREPGRKGVENFTGGGRRGWKVGFPRRQEAGPLRKHLAMVFSICHRKTGMTSEKQSEGQKPEK